MFDDDQGRNWKKVWYHARSWFAVLLSLAVLGGGLYYVGDKASTAWKEHKAATDFQGTGTKPVQVTIPPGATGGQIGRLLVDKGVVKSSKGFLKAFNANNDAQKIQAGTYQLMTEIPSATAVEMLLDKKNQVHNLVTVPEGLWMSEQFALLSKKTGIPVKDFEQAAEDPQALGLPSWVGDSAEGYLFPSTYEIGQKPTAKSILTQMAKEFVKVADKYDIKDKAQRQARGRSDLVTIASLVQAEAQPKDYAMVAGILDNRLSKGMQLQLDSTSHYGLKIPMNKPLPAGFKDTWEPYNTYQIGGLPPTPINAPGEAALKAAMMPKENDYLFWVTVNFKTGETKFAKTYEEHQKYVAEWEAWCKTSQDKSGCGA